MNITFIDKKYSWSNMSLWDFLQEGNIPHGWEDFFVKNQDIILSISNKIEEKKSNPKLIIYPPINKIFRAFIPIDKIRVLICGMDPYHNGTTENDGSAVGLCFSVLPGNSINPSLRNIYKELKRDNLPTIENGILTQWVDQGCFMLNMALTVEKGCPDSHTSIWYEFSEKVVKHISNHGKQIAWLLMGANARKIQHYVSPNHLVVLTSHPSPFSFMRSSGNIPAFLGSGCFSQINNYIHKPKIKW